MERLFLLLASLNGFMAVAFGAFGAHGLKVKMAVLPDGAQRLEWWHTGAHYHLMHALALAVSAYLAQRSQSAAATVSGFAFVVGIVLFSGSLYTMTLTGIRVLGAVTPFGGTAFLVGWVSLGVAALSLRT